MNIHELLTMLRKQDGALLGNKTAEVLSTFLLGYAFARRESGFPDDERFLDAFNLWVSRRYKNEEGQGWAKLVSFYSSNATEEWKLFWKLLDEYESRPRKSAPNRTESQEPNLKVPSNKKASVTAG